MLNRIRRTRPIHSLAPARENFRNQIADERFATLFQRHVRAEIMRVAKQCEDLLVTVTHAHEFLDECLRHLIRGVFMRQERHAVQLKRIFKIEFVFWHLLCYSNVAAPLPSPLPVKLPARYFFILSFSASGDMPFWPGFH